MINGNGINAGNSAKFSYSFRTVLGWTLLWAVLATFTNFFIGMVVAIVINKKGIRLKKLWRTILVTTIAVPQFVSLLLMNKMLQGDGVYNNLISMMGGSTLNFLTDPLLAKVTVVIVNLWVGIPYTVLSCTGILMNIPDDLYEAAKIDGANAYKMYMKLGRIQQIDTPQNLYDYPENKFVAGFIGTPQMNFFEATMKREGNDVKVKFDYCDNELVVPFNDLLKVRPKYLNGKEHLWVGLRCENISINENDVKNSHNLMKVKVSHFEELGNETLVYGDLNMKGDGFVESSTRVIIKSYHVSDITSSSTWGGYKDKSTLFNGAYQSNTTYTSNGTTVSTGFDNIKELGVNALQLQPIYDQANDETTRKFNWGYNPLNYNCLEGLYSSNPYDGKARIQEFKELVKAYNEAGINIIMDVVYNHAW